MNQYRTYTCNQISLEDVGKKVRIAVKSGKEI